MALLIRAGENTTTKEREEIHARTFSVGTHTTTTTRKFDVSRSCVMVMDGSRRGSGGGRGPTLPPDREWRKGEKEKENERKQTAFWLIVCVHTKNVQKPLNEAILDANLSQLCKGFRLFSQKSCSPDLTLFPIQKSGEYLGCHPPSPSTTWLVCVLFNCRTETESALPLSCDLCCAAALPSLFGSPSMAGFLSSHMMKNRLGGEGAKLGCKHNMVSPPLLLPNHITPLDATFLTSEQELRTRWDPEGSFLLCGEGDRLLAPFQMLISNF